MEGSFWDSNLFQTLVLIVTAGITLWIYFARRKANVRNAVTILMLQIRDIEKTLNIYCQKELLMEKFKKNHCIILQLYMRTTTGRSTPT